MRTPHRTPALVAGIALAVAATVSLPAPCGGQTCVRTTMVAGTSYALTSTPADFVIPAAAQPSGWVTVGVRAEAGGDWDPYIYPSEGAYPVCVGGDPVRSFLSGDSVEVIVRSHHSSPPTTAYARFQRYTGAQGARAQWRPAGTALVVDGPYRTGTLSTDDVLHTFTVSLVRDSTYTIVFVHGAPRAKLLVFARARTNGTGVVRGAAVAVVTGTRTFVPTDGGEYLFVLVNDSREYGDYYVGIGRCAPPVALPSNGSTVSTTKAVEHWSLYGQPLTWSAMVVRSSANDQLALYDSPSGGQYPECFGGQLAWSNETDRSELVAFYRRTETGRLYYATTSDVYGGAGVTAAYTSNFSDSLVVDGPARVVTTDATHPLRIWGVSLTAGFNYQFYFRPSGASCRMVMFRPATANARFDARAQASFDLATSTSFTATETGKYGLAIVNEDGMSGSYVLGVSRAPCTAPIVLSSGVSVATTSPEAYFELASPIPYWGVMAVRGSSASDDWDLAVSTSPTGTPAPGCIGPVLASSGYAAGVIDFVAFDFNSSNSEQVRWARAHHASATSAAGTAEWDRGGIVLDVGDAVLHDAVAAQDLVRVYDAYMVAGQTYTIDFQPSFPGLTALVLENPGTTLLAASRSSAIASGGGVFDCTASSTGYHAIVVTNDGAGDVPYAIRYGRCATPAALASRVVTPTQSSVSTFSFSPPDPSWVAAGVHAVTTDWDLDVGSSADGAFPQCVTATLAGSYGSALSYVDLVAGDFHHAPGATHYLEARQYDTAPTVPTTVQWDRGGGEVPVNLLNAPQQSMPSGELLRAYDLQLAAGTTYTITLAHSGTAALRLLLFRNPGGGAYWAGRASALLELPVATGSTTFTAPATDDYGIVVVNDSGAPDQFTVRVRHCPPPSPLASGAPVASFPQGYFSFQQTAGYWMAVGTRSSTDWDIEVDSLGSGGAAGICFSAPLAQSAQSGNVDFVVGDFNTGANRTGTYYARAYAWPSTPTPGVTEYAGTSQTLTVNGPRIVRTAESSRLLRIWDVFLSAGTTYRIVFSRSGEADLKALLYRNPAGTYWAPRSARVLETTTSATYVAPSTDWYGLVVVNDNGQPGEFTLGLYNGTAAAEETAPPALTALHGVSPNPAHGDFTVEFSLREQAVVSVDVLDMAGRRVAIVSEGPRDSGRWRISWTGAGRDRGELPPGLYFVRLRAGDRTVGMKKLAIVH